MDVIPLRYNISDWHQLSECKSNNSADLYIAVSDYINNDSLVGTGISVCHRTLGVLFSYVVDGRGEIIDPDDYHGLTTKQILHELSRYGFLVTFDPHRHLPGPQLAFLLTLQGLHYDKIRLLTVTSGQFASTYVVAFMTEFWPELLDNTATMYSSQFVAGVAAGTIFNISTISETENYRWDWLDYVANIDDIIADNA